MKYLLLIILYTSCSFIQICNAQTNTGDSSSKPKISHFFIGPGIGLDHGGIGIQFHYAPLKWVSVFAGGGSNLSHFTYTLGTKFSARIDPTFGLYATGFYGFNGTLFSFNGTGIFDNMYSTGFSGGGGIELTLGKNETKLNIGVIITKRELPYNSYKVSALNAIALGLKYPLDF